MVVRIGNLIVGSTIILAKIDSDRAFFRIDRIVRDWWDPTILLDLFFYLALYENENFETLWTKWKNESSFKDHYESFEI